MKIDRPRERHSLSALGGGTAAKPSGLPVELAIVGKSPTGATKNESCATGGIHQRRVRTASGSDRILCATQHKHLFRKLLFDPVATDLLIAWSNGDQTALERLMPLVEAELRRIAKSYMRKEAKGHLLQTTALVNEAFLRLVDQENIQWQNRVQFFGIAAKFMRRLLIDFARAEHRAKRGGNAQLISLSEAEDISTETSDGLLALNEALERLATIDERKGKVVELRYFGGLSVKETAEVLQVSSVTVMRDWNMARAWLRRELNPR